MLEPDVLRHFDGDRSGVDQVVLEAGKDLFKGLQPSRQPTMGVPVLRRADSRPSGCRQIVAIENLDLTEIRRQCARGCQAPDAATNNHRTTETMFHPAPLRPSEQTEQRRLATAGFQATDKALPW